MAKFEIKTDQGTFDIDSESSQEEVEAYFSTPEGQAELTKQLASISEAPVAPAAPESSGRGNLAGFLEGTGLPDLFGVSGKEIADSPATDLLVGAGRTATSVKRGLEQLASTPEEALALAKIEEKERKAFEEFDEGLGLEDVGESMVFLSSLLVPGGNVVQGASLAGKTLNGLRNLGSSLGGASIITGLIEGSKAVTEDESQGTNALVGFGTTLAGGKAIQGAGNIVKNSFKEGVIGKTLAAFGLGTLAQGPGRRVISEGLSRRFLRSLFGKKPGAGEQELRLAAAQGGQEVRRLTAAAAQAEAKIADKQFGLQAGNPVWDSWLDIVKGPKSPKTGRRLKGSSLEGARGSKAAKEAKIDIAQEKHNVVATLMGASMKKNSETGEVVFDLPAVDAAWRQLKQSPNFQRVYGSIRKDGTFSPGKVAKEVDTFIEKMLTTGKAEGATTLTAPEILKRGAQDVVDATERGLSRVAQVREAASTKPGGLSAKGVGLNAAAVAFEQVISNEGIAEAQKIVEGGDWMGFVDYFDTLAERARAVENAE